MKKSFPRLIVFKSDGGFEMSAAAILVVAARTFYGFQPEKNPELIENATTTMQEILAAVRSARYALIPQLIAALASGECTYRLGKMANEACAKVPVPEMREILARVKFI